MKKNRKKKAAPTYYVTYEQMLKLAAGNGDLTARVLAEGANGYFVQEVVEDGQLGLAITSSVMVGYQHRLEDERFAEEVERAFDEMMANEERKAS